MVDLLPTTEVVADQLEAEIRRIPFLARVRSRGRYHPHPWGW
jgi:hypothetical protein